MAEFKRWLFRIPDLPVLLTRLAPALGRRLAASDCRRMSTAAEELSGLAQSLQKMMEQFRLGGEAEHGVTVL